MKMMVRVIKLEIETKSNIKQKAHCPISTELQNTK